MGESVTNALGAVAGAFDLNAIIASFAGLIDMLPAPIKEFYNSYSTLCLMALACLLALLGFEGYKIFKMLLYAGGAFGFAFIGFAYIAPYIPENIKQSVPDVVNIDVLLALVCALLAVFICKCANTLMIMILGGVVGYLVGANFVYGLLVEQFNTLEFLQIETVKHIVGGAIASVMVLVFILIFKHAYIVGTSFGCPIASALVVQSILMPAADISVQICFILIGVALGIFAVAHQYKEEEKAMEIVFY